MRQFALKTLALAACALGLSALPASAGALVYTFNQDQCTNGCGLSNYGTVTLTDISGGVNVHVQLAGGSGLVDTGALDFHSLIFNLPFAATIAGLPGGGWTWTNTTYVSKGNMFGTFNYLIDCNAACGPNAPYTAALDFNVNGSGFDVTSFADGGTPSDTYFVADISNPNLPGGPALTGRIGATYTGTTTTQAPEPFTMSLFGAGLAGMAALRRRRKSNSGAAAA